MMKKGGRCTQVIYNVFGCFVVQVRNSKVSFLEESRFIETVGLQR